ncbi:MAG TPA: hypothetical protein VNQ79_23520 [Blastocatellia bacterium]|nr:hypothetical protein [Blastocatellia bacterium]
MAFSNYRLWYRAAAWYLLLAGAAQAVGHYFFFADASRFAPQRLALARTMQAYTADPLTGASMWRQVQMFSLAFALLLVFAGLINLMIARSELPLTFLKRMIRFNLIFWAAAFCFLLLHPVTQPLVISGFTSLLLAVALWRTAGEQP